MKQTQIIREMLSDRYYEWIQWKGTRHEKEALEELIVIAIRLKDTLPSKH